MSQAFSAIFRGRACNYNLYMGMSSAAAAGANIECAMAIGKLTLELSIPHAQSLKDRRQVVRSLKDKLRHAFNLSVAEMNEGATLWNQATIVVAVVSSSTSLLAQQLETIDRAAQRISVTLSAEISDAYAEILAD